MKLILQAIKALFRKVENSISQSVAKLQKQIDSVKSTAKKDSDKVKASADEAQATAEAAQATAEAAQATAEAAQATAEAAQATANANAGSWKGNIIDTINITEAIDIEVGQSHLIELQASLNTYGVGYGKIMITEFKAKIGNTTSNHSACLTATGNSEVCGILRLYDPSYASATSMKIFAVTIRFLTSSNPKVMLTRLA